MASLQKAFINPWSHVDYFYDGWMCFLCFKISIHSHYKAWKSQDIFFIYIILTVFG